MKVFVFAVVVLCALLTIEASPVKQVKPKCSNACAAVSDPVCAGVPNDKSVKPRLFGNQCVLDIHNCEHNSNLVKISADECKNAGGIRLF